MMKPIKISAKIETVEGITLTQTVALPNIRIDANGRIHVDLTYYSSEEALVNKAQPLRVTNPRREMFEDVSKIAGSEEFMIGIGKALEERLKEANKENK